MIRLFSCLGLSISLFLISTLTSKAQTDCDSSILGLWKVTSDPLSEVMPMFYRYDEGGTVTVIMGQRLGNSMEYKEMARGEYKLDDPQKPTTIQYSHLSSGLFQSTQDVTMRIIKLDDKSFEFINPLFGPTTYTKVASYKYYIAFIAREASPSSPFGHTFVQWIKLDGRQTQTQAYGFYPEKHSLKLFFVSVSGVLQNEYLKDNGIAGSVILRIQVSAADFERTLRVKDAWKNKEFSDKLDYNLYSASCKNFVQTVAATLNLCKRKIQLPAVTTFQYPFSYLTELKRLNRSLDTSIQQMYAR